MRRTPKRTVIATLAALPLIAAGAAVSAQAASAAPAGTVQAESYSAQHGVRTQPTSDTGGGSNLGWLESGDWAQYQGVDLGAGGMLDVEARIASATSHTGAVELHLDSPTGPLLASVPSRGTGGWQRWVTAEAMTTGAPAGKHTIAVVFASPTKGDFVNLNWFSVGASDSMPSSMPMPSSSPSMSMPAGGGMIAPPKGEWVPVDPAKQAAATKAFFARTPAKITGNPVKVPEFHATCTVSHFAKDDPIVFPGMPGASHHHTFFGNDSTNASSTLGSLRAATTNCTPQQDESAYWVPTLYANGVQQDPTQVTVYYGSRLKDPSRTQPFPAGFKELTGNAMTQTDTPDHQGNHFFCAGIGGSIGRSADGTMPICAKTAHIVRQVVFADCWDGKHLDSPDHKSHVAEVVAGKCPAAFPVPIPNVSLVIDYPAGMDVQHISLASGTTFSMHADFFNAWDDDALAQRVRDCLDQGVKCNAAGGF
ncbi:DUF1996 domain-containing protein [Amnibacterium setariae]|uniref:DUF1996 domain-containing protein n=1 Tax=Amnibacterium setariae TaxID=2306585 RepID=A0A3A1U6M1_9MICO|nr:DUF1996 domain-containing protein [Amnibacterium setariae]RIX28574.1 DUF1996 domain-containing protein [Amnibacterium setariae]